MTNEYGAVVWRSETLPFGQELVALNAEKEHRMSFPGQYRDEESGMSYNYFRDYDASVGRYVQSDPSGLSGGINSFVYVESNPIRYYDNLGLQLVYGPEYNPLINKIMQNEFGAHVVSTLQNSTIKYTIGPTKLQKGAFFDSTSVRSAAITMYTPTMKVWVNTESGGFALVSADRILFHELGHAYNYDQKIGPKFDRSYDSLDYWERDAAEENFVIGVYGNNYGDGINRIGHAPACPVVLP